MSSNNKNQERIWSEILFPSEDLEFTLQLYETYHSELREVKKKQQEFYARKDKIGLVPQLGDLEAEITYLRIRQCKPASVVEISPASGWSTSWILHALKDNGAGTLYSYDLVDDSVRTVPKELSDDRWKFFIGDVIENAHLIPKEIDYLFIDSDHSEAFAHLYIKHLFPKMLPGTKVSVHDILKLSHEPGWGEESLILCSWLGEKKIPCSTASRALKDKGYDKIMAIRKKLKLDFTIHPPDYNSMIFFSL
jgi:predicted O-methyltransferase YrrM